MASGIDVSNNNGHLDWASIAHSGVKYAYAKATEGTGFVDGFYQENRRGAAAHGIAFGAYHFYTPGEDPQRQVEFFLEHAQPKHGDLVPALDYERPPADKAPAEAFVVATHRELGYYPMFYTFLSFVQSRRIPASSPLAHCGLWLADFTTVRPAPPAPWHEITIWQHSSTGRVPGIGGPVDLDTGTPHVVPTPSPKHWDATYHNKDGSKHTTRIRRPAFWLMRHPRKKFNGRVVFDPVKR